MQNIKIAEEWLESEGLPRIPVDESKELEDGKSGSAELASGKEKTSSEKEKSGEFVDIAAELKAEKDKYDYKNVTWIRSTIGSIILYLYASVLLLRVLVSGECCNECDDVETAQTSD